MKRLIIILTLFISSPLLAQNQTSYQYLFNPLPINPAFTGYFDVLSASAQTRIQSLGVPGAPATQLLGIHAPIGNQAALGLQAWNETMGVDQSTGVFGSYAYRIQMNAFKLAAGIQAGFAINETDFASLKTRQGNDPVFSKRVQSFQPNVGVGILLSNENVYLGISMPRMLNQSNSYTRSNQILGVVGYSFTLNSQLKIQPNVLLRVTAGQVSEVIFNTTLHIKEVLGIGASYQLNQSLAGIIQLRLTDQLRLGYALESDALSNLSANASSHELTLHYLFKSSRKMAFSPRYF